MGRPSGSEEPVLVSSKQRPQLSVPFVCHVVAKTARPWASLSAHHHRWTQTSCGSERRRLCYESYPPIAKKSCFWCCSGSPRMPGRPFPIQSSYACRAVQHRCRPEVCNSAEDAGRSQGSTSQWLAMFAAEWKVSVQGVESRCSEETPRPSANCHARALRRCAWLLQRDVVHFLGVSFSPFLSPWACRLEICDFERAFPSAQKACNLQHKVAGAVHLCLFWQEADALLCPTTRRGRIPFPSACPQKRLQLGDSQCILSYLLMCEHV